MKLKSDFSKLCQQLEQCEKGTRTNPIKCARCKLNQYVHNDLDLLLKIKAEANAMTSMDFWTSMLSIASFAISILALLYDHLPVIVVLLLLLIILFPLHRAIPLTYPERKWQSYILTVIDEIEEKIKTNKKDF